jgi:hypothetical protein
VASLCSEAIVNGTIEMMKRKKYNERVLVEDAPTDFANKLESQ